MLFFIFLSNHATIFFNKNRCFSYIYYISLKCFNNFNKTDSEKINEEILNDKNTKYYIENICHQFPDLYMS